MVKHKGLFFLQGAVVVMVGKRGWGEEECTISYFVKKKKKKKKARGKKLGILFV